MWNSFDGAAAEDLCISHADKLSSPESQRIKAGDAGSALLSGIGIIEAVIVKEIVCRKAVPIDRHWHRVARKTYRRAPFVDKPKWKID